MQKLQRKVGLLLPRTADDAQVGLLLKDFDDGDRILKTVRTTRLLQQRRKLIFIRLSNKPRHSESHGPRFFNVLAGPRPTSMDSINSYLGNLMRIIAIVLLSGNN